MARTAAGSDSSASRAVRSIRHSDVGRELEVVVVAQQGVVPGGGADDGTPYQRMLRAVGAYLDAQYASQIFLLETADGMLVRYQSRDAASEPMSIRLGLADLAVWDCRHGRRRSGQHGQGVGGRYEDVLRAIGYELEHAAARHIALDELDGTYILTYQHIDAVADAVLRKHRTTITPLEAEQLLRSARGRRRGPVAGWLLESSRVSSDPVRVVRLRQAEPCLVPVPFVLYEYTVPSMSERTVSILRGESREIGATYNPSRAGTRDMLIEHFEAAALVSSVYARCLDPLRFSTDGREAQGKEQVVAAFVRSLTTRRVLAAVELVAANIDGLRSLDAYQDGLGTTTVRWMQYLAAEALTAIGAGPSGVLPEQQHLRCWLSTIHGSVSAADRFAAMGRASVSDSSRPALP